MSGPILDWLDLQIKVGALASEELRAARTSADLSGDEQVTAPRLAEALQYRAYEARHREAG